MFNQIWRRPVLIATLLLAIGCASPAEKIEDLMDTIAWTEKDSDTWNDAVDALVEMDRTAARQLVAAMDVAWHKGEHFREYKDEINDIRAGAARVLGRLKYRQGAATVIGYVTTDYPTYVRVECAWAFGETADEKAFEESHAKLDALLKDSNSEVRLAGAIALCKLDDEKGGEYLVEMLGSEDKSISQDAEDGLIEADYHAVDVLVKVLESGDEAIRPKVKKILGTIREHLLVELEDEDKEVRREAARALGSIKDKRDAERLARRLGDEDSLVRFEAGISLSKMGDERGRDYLLKALGSEDNVSRTGAIKALVEAGGAVEEMLIGHLGDENPLIRSGAAQVLGEGKVRRAVPDLISALEDTSAAVRWNVAIALSKIGDERTLEPLTLLQQDKDVVVAHYAKWALAKLRGEERSPVTVDGNLSNSIKTHQKW